MSDTVSKEDEDFSLRDSKCYFIITLLSLDDIKLRFVCMLHNSMHIT